jgi:cupin 2 domain-containing protein
MNEIERKNFFDLNLVESENEFFETLISGLNFKVERIVSNGHITPVNEIYDQEHDEWVILLKGKAIIDFYNPDQSVELAEGDHILIPAHRQHRVIFTDINSHTIWLAIHFLNTNTDLI